MGITIGLVSERAEVVVEVTSIATRIGADVASLRCPDPALSRGESVAWPGLDVDFLLVDVAAVPDSTPQPAAHPWGTSPASCAVICRAGEEHRARSIADVVGSDHVVALPVGSVWLEGALAPRSRASTLGVLGVLGGVGATTTAIASAWGADDDCLLVDADPDSVGMDLPLGLPEGVGARWAQIPISAAPLDPASLRASLPRVGAVAVATGPDDAGRFDQRATSRGRRVAGVVTAGRAEFQHVVVDLGRGHQRADVLDELDAVAVVLPATVAGVVAAQSLLAELPADRVVAVVRPSRWLAATDAADQLEVPVTVTAPHLRRAPELADCGDLLSGRTGRALRALGERVWAVGT